jgi:solute carrier family 45 protein 1/2/4
MAPGPKSPERAGEQQDRSGETQDPATYEITKPLDEESPLLSPTRDEEQEGLIEDGSVRHDRDESFETKPLWYMILLTISIGGLQLAWAVELSNGSPYLLSLGLSKSLMALVWIAGPLTGTIVQPYVGILSDNCRSSWGKRTPFMIAGSAATIISLLALAWVREIVGGFLGLCGVDRESEGVKVAIIVVAVLFVYVLDVAINTGRIRGTLQPFCSDISKCKQELELSFWTVVRAINKVSLN